MVDLLTLSSLSDFWNIPAVHVNIIIFFNLVGALFLGLIVGYERTYHGRAAGMRTYGLVCMASAALTVISAYSPYWLGGHALNLAPIDPTRTIQGIVTGIGFLGAGIIMKDERSISGLTTAASVWASSAIGIMIGLGFYLSAILLTLLSVGFMMWGLRIESWLPSRPAITVLLRFQKSFSPQIDNIQRVVVAHGYEIARGTISISSTNGQSEWRFIAISFGKSEGAPLVEIAQSLSKLKGLETFNLSHARN